jgi:glycosyltransferase involved in cell wall biosynthesis
VHRTKLIYFVTEDWYFCSHRLTLAVAAQAAGYDVTVVTRVREHGDMIRAAGLKLIPFEIARTSVNPLREFGTLWRLVRMYRREQPQIVHHVAMKPVLYGTIAARFAGARVINALAGMGWLFTSGGGKARTLKPVVRWTLGRLLRRGIALVQNPDDARLLEKLGVAPEQIRLIPGAGVDLQAFSPRPEPEGVPVVVLPARLLWDKGVGEFVAAARLLQGKGIAVRFVLAGQPDEANPSAVPREQIAAWVTEGIITHLGWAKDMPAVLAGCHIVCLPSYYGEGIPKSLIEAAACGRPIVTTDMPGCREIVHHGDNGLLVPPRDAAALAGALEQLLGDAAMRERMGARGRQRAEQEFGLERVIQQTLALYVASEDSKDAKLG